MTSIRKQFSSAFLYSHNALYITYIHIYMLVFAMPIDLTICSCAHNQTSRRSGMHTAVTTSFSGTFTLRSYSFKHLQSERNVVTKHYLYPALRE